MITFKDWFKAVFSSRWAARNFLSLITLWFQVVRNKPDTPFWRAAGELNLKLIREGGMVLEMSLEPDSIDAMIQDAYLILVTYSYKLPKVACDDVKDTLKGRKLDYRGRAVMQVIGRL